MTTQSMGRMEAKNLDRRPDDTIKFDNGKLDIATIGEATVGRFTLEPGWKWSTSVKPIVKTDSCQQHHTGYIVSGRMRVRMNDGKEMECGPGEVAVIPPGHDAWVVGSEPCIGIDFTGARTYAKK
jgi:uncharacterized cupin superfamily protein